MMAWDGIQLHALLPRVMPFTVCLCIVKVSCIFCRLVFFVFFLQNVLLLDWIHRWGSLSFRFFFFLLWQSLSWTFAECKIDWAIIADNVVNRSLSKHKSRQSFLPSTSLHLILTSLSFTVCMVILQCWHFTKQKLERKQKLKLVLISCHAIHNVFFE